MGQPVIATPKATGGLLVRKGENIIVRDDPRAFAVALVESLS
jgi:hypothetical protein